MVFSASGDSIRMTIPFAEVSPKARECSHGRELHIHARSQEALSDRDLVASADGKSSAVLTPRAYTVPHVLF